MVALVTCSLIDIVLPMLSFRLLFTYSLEIPSKIVPTAIFEANRLHDKKKDHFKEIIVDYTRKMLIDN